MVKAEESFFRVDLIPVGVIRGFQLFLFNAFSKKSLFLFMYALSGHLLCIVLTVSQIMRILYITFIPLSLIFAR